MQVRQVPEERGYLGPPLLFMVCMYKMIFGILIHPFEGHVDFFPIQTVYTILVPRCVPTLLFVNEVSAVAVPCGLKGGYNKTNTKYICT